MRARILVGDCRESMRTLPDASVDSVVCDPPYELGFMGKGWDASGIAYDVDVWRQALRVLKPGGHLLAFSGSRTYHRMTVAIEDAGFEIRDSLMWLYGSGFPKSLDVSKALDRAAGAEREVVGTKLGMPGYSLTDGKGGLYGCGIGANGIGAKECEVTAPATDAARQWAGWGTALKPAWEPIVLARKPLSGTVAANVERYGTGAINVDGCRVDAADGRPLIKSHAEKSVNTFGHGLNGSRQAGITTDGRWPANVILSHDPACGDACAPGCPCAMLDEQSGGEGASRYFNQLPITRDDFPPFIYTAKAGRSDREEGCEDRMKAPARSAMNTHNGTSDRFDGAPTPVRGNVHPTVKPTELMRHLCRLVTPPGGTVLDPFMGSGSTGRGAMLEGFRFIGCELSPEYAEIALGRIRYTLGPLFAREADYG